MEQRRYKIIYSLFYYEFNSKEINTLTRKFNSDMAAIKFIINRNSPFFGRFIKDSGKLLRERR